MVFFLLPLQRHKAETMRAYKVIEVIKLLEFLLNSIWKQAGWK
jgi:hypothetical protein